MPVRDHREFFDLAAQAAHHKREMVLWPVLWRKYNGRKTLRWKHLVFRKISRKKVPTRPGVYAFLVKPSLANLNVAYPMYIGKATKSLRTRFGAYLTREKDPYKGRPKMATLLHQYEGYLHFCFATLVSSSTVSRTEKKLISAFKPPVNDEIEADVRRVTAAF